MFDTCVTQYFKSTPSVASRGELGVLVPQPPCSNPTDAPGSPPAPSCDLSSLKPGRSSPSRSPPSLVRPWVTPSLVLPQKAAGGPGPHRGPSSPTCHSDSQSSKTNRAPAALGLGRCCAPSQDQVEPWSRRPGRCWPLAQGRCQCRAAATPSAACTECRLLAQSPCLGTWQTRAAQPPGVSVQHRQGVQTTATTLGDSCCSSSQYVKELRGKRRQMNIPRDSCASLCSVLPLPPPPRESPSQSSARHVARPISPGSPLPALYAANDTHLATKLYRAPRLRQVRRSDPSHVTSRGPIATTDGRSQHLRGGGAPLIRDTLRLCTETHRAAEPRLFRTPEWRNRSRGPGTCFLLLPLNLCSSGTPDPERCPLLSACLNPAPWR